MIKRLFRLFKLLHIKWVRHECHRMCAWCQYQDMCWDDLDIK